MRKVRLFLSMFFALFVYSISAQQTILGDLTLGELNPANLGWGNRLHLRGAAYNTDDIWLGRFSVDNTKTDLRIFIGDDNSNDDRFVIGNSYWSSQNVWNEWFVVTNKGRVGIGGISYPENALEVNGTIRAKEIRVETAWADFVFDADYNLPSLKEVESHIKAHKHLPGIPTETDIKKNGTNLGEMNVKLLQKIEELTLYMIQQSKDIESLKSEVQKLKN